MDWLAQVSAQRSLTGIRVIHARAEEQALEKGFRDSFDLVTARAVAALRLLCELCLPYVKVGGAFLAMKSVDCGRELEEAAHCIKLLGGRVEERSFFDVAKRDFENRQAVNFAVRLDGKLIGEAVLYRFDWRGGAELGCRIDKAYAGNGYGTEAFAAVAEWGLYKIHLSRVVAKCYKENQASYKMLSACMRKKGEDDTFFYFEKLV